MNRGRSWLVEDMVDKGHSTDSAGYFAISRLFH